MADSVWSQFVLSMKRMLLKYFPFFLAYLFWVVLIGAMVCFGFYCEAIEASVPVDASPEKLLEIQRTTFHRVFPEFFLKAGSKIWYYPLLLSVITAVVVQCLPHHRADES